MKQNATMLTAELQKGRHDMLLGEALDKPVVTSRRPCRMLIPSVLKCALSWHYDFTYWSCFVCFSNSQKSSLRHLWGEAAAAVPKRSPLHWISAKASRISQELCTFRNPCTATLPTLCINCSIAVSLINISSPPLAHNSTLSSSAF